MRLAYKHCTLKHDKNALLLRYAQIVLTTLQWEIVSDDWKRDVLTTSLGDHFMQPIAKRPSLTFRKKSLYYQLRAQ